jgi:hypothetical protein
MESVHQVTKVRNSNPIIPGYDDHPAPPKDAPEAGQQLKNPKRTP